MRSRFNGFSLQAQQDSAHGFTCVVIVWTVCVFCCFFFLKNCSLHICVPVVGFFPLFFFRLHGTCKSFLSCLFFFQYLLAISPDWGDMSRLICIQKQSAASELNLNCPYRHRRVNHLTFDGCFVIMWRSNLQLWLPKFYRRSLVWTVWSV